MLRHLNPIPAFALLVLLAACGGGSGTNVSITRLLPTIWTSEGRAINSCSLSPSCSGNPYAPFFASLSMAPANGATLSGVVRLEVRGNEMANIELLPAGGDTPRLGVFNITGDRTLAWLDFDTTVLPNGPLSVRISAFNVPAGQPGATEIVAMPARTWTINNTAAQPPGFSATVTAAPADNAVVSGITRLEIHGAGIANAELLPASGYAPRFGVFNVSTDRTMAWLDFDSRSLPDGITDVRISAFNLEQGQPGVAEIVAMPVRRWDLRNGTAASGTTPFIASVSIAPVHGAIVSGLMRLEVRGSGMRNVELLPTSGYTPRLGVFNVSFDQTFAWLDVDTTTLPNGILEARISAFNMPEGQPGATEIIAMPPRQWNVRH